MSSFSINLSPGEPTMLAPIDIYYYNADRYLDANAGFPNQIERRHFEKGLLEALAASTLLKDKIKWGLTAQILCMELFDPWWRGAGERMGLGKDQIDAYADYLHAEKVVIRPCLFDFTIETDNDHTPEISNHTPEIGKKRKRRAEEDEDYSPNKGLPEARVKARGGRSAGGPSTSTARGGAGMVDRAIEGFDRDRQARAKAQAEAEAGAEDGSNA